MRETIHGIVNGLLTGVPEEVIAGACAVFALFLAGFSIGLAYGIFMELSEKQRWGRYFANDEFFQSLHCRCCSLSRGRVEGDSAPADPGSPHDAARAADDGGALTPCAGSSPSLTTAGPAVVASDATPLGVGISPASAASGASAGPASSQTLDGLRSRDVA